MNRIGWATAFAGAVFVCSGTAHAQEFATQGTFAFGVFLFSGINQDNGNINYRKHDLIAAPTKFTPTVNFSWNNFQGKLRGIAYYDPVNVNFEEHHNDTRLQPRETRRPDSIESVPARLGASPRPPSSSVSAA